MRIAFYAPLKPPGHPVPSGDREMARLLVRAMERAGHEVELASGFRSFRSEPPAHAEMDREAAGEVERLTVRWKESGPPRLWFTYHPYYKAPDLVGPRMAAGFGIPYVTAEASYSPKREQDGWAGSQRHVLEAVEAAALNLCFTRRDLSGLAAAAPGARFALLAPFIDTAPFTALEPTSPPEPGRLATVAMMRPGDKLASYRMLAEALSRIVHLPWTLTVVGDGPARGAVAEAFRRLPAARIEMLGGASPEAVPGLLGNGSIYVWPGCGEAYGLAYLEAQAAGLPAVAQNTAGVPEVVEHGRTGVLTPPGDVAAYAGAIARLLGDEEERRALGAAARRFVLGERSLDAASQRLGALLAQAVAR